MKFFSLIFALPFLISSVCAFNILLVFPYPGRSHEILGEGYVRHLLNAGHNVTYVSSTKVMKPHPRLKHVDVSSNYKLFDHDKIFNFDDFLTHGKFSMPIWEIIEFVVSLGNITIYHENVQKLLLDLNEKFDLAVVEWMYSEVYSGFGAVFDCPFVWSSSVEPHPLVLRLIDEAHNPAYFPDHISPVTLPLTFIERVQELVIQTLMLAVKMVMNVREEKIFSEGFSAAATQRGVSLPTLDESKYKGSLMLGNSHVSSGEAHRLPQSYIPIGGYHIADEVQPLPEDLQKLMDSAQDGVIYFSMGTMMKSRTMPEHFKRALLKVFSELKQTVIWKFEDEMTDLPKNVRILQWAPQQSILAHPNCILFITHGGLLSTTETLHFGVPIIGIPLFADQHLNVVRAEHKGYAVKVDLSPETPEKLKEAIYEMLSNSKYQERVKELSFIYHHRPTKPGAALVHWIEHVILTKGARHLQSPALYVPFYQKYYLDLLAVILISYYVSKRIVRKLFGGPRNTVKVKKN